MHYNCIFLISRYQVNLNKAEPHPISCAHVATTRELHTAHRKALPGSRPCGKSAVRSADDTNKISIIRGFFVSEHSVDITLAGVL